MPKEEVKILPLEEKIAHLLNEIRIVVPGTEALFGFQLASIFTETFNSFPDKLRYVHIASLYALTLAIIFLLSTPAYDRLVQRNMATEAFHTYASRAILIALAFLTLGLSGDVYIALMLGLKSETAALCGSVFIFILCVLFWFGYGKLVGKREKF